MTKRIRIDMGDELEVEIVDQYGSRITIKNVVVESRVTDGQRVFVVFRGKVSQDHVEVGKKTTGKSTCPQCGEASVPDGVGQACNLCGWESIELKTAREKKAEYAAERAERQRAEREARREREKGQAARDAAAERSARGASACPKCGWVGFVGEMHLCDAGVWRKGPQYKADRCSMCGKSLSMFGFCAQPGCPNSPYASEYAEPRHTCNRCGTFWRGGPDCPVCPPRPKSPPDFCKKCGGPKLAGVCFVCDILGPYAKPAPIDWQKTLGPCATLAEAKSAYRRLAHEHHPDRGGSTEKMIEINAAWTEAQKALTR